MMPLVFVNHHHNSNQQFIYMNLTLVSATELSNDLKHKTEYTLNHISLEIFSITKNITTKTHLMANNNLINTDNRFNCTVESLTKMVQI